jgi:hypothetical protein
MAVKRKTDNTAAEKPSHSAPKKVKVTDFGAALTALSEAPAAPAPRHTETTTKSTKNGSKSNEKMRDSLNRSAGQLSAASQALSAAKDKIREKRKKARGSSDAIVADVEKISAVAKTQAKHKKLLLEKDHVDAQHTELEKRLIRIATKGVVTLFNAVNEQQKKIDDIQNSKSLRADEKDKLQRRETDRGFLEILKDATRKAAGGAPAEEDASDADTAAPAAAAQGDAAVTKSNWSVFDEGYLVGKQKMKNWNDKV